MGSGDQPETKRRLWFIEMWIEGRDIFKAIIRDVLFFLLLMSVLAGGRWLLETLDLTQDQRHLIESWHFKITISAWILLSLLLLLEICVGIGTELWERIADARKRIRNAGS